MSERGDAWPALVCADLAPMVDYVNRLVEVGGKYTLDEPFETGCGNIVLDVTSRGLRTPTFRRRGVTFAVHYRLLDGGVVIEADTGVPTLPLAGQSVAAFYASFLSHRGRARRRHRPRAGVMWGGFDLSATRFRARSGTAWFSCRGPRSGRPPTRTGPSWRSGMPFIRWLWRRRAGPRTSSGLAATAGT